jgi:integrase
VIKVQGQIAAACYSLSTYKPAPEETLMTSGSKCPDGAPIFGLLSPTNFDDLKARFPGWSWICTARNNALFAAGLMDDWPAQAVSRAKLHKRQGSKADEPYSDAAFTEILRVALWLSALTPEALAAYLRIRAIATAPDGRKRTGAVSAHRTALIRAWVPGGRLAGEPLPYGLRLHGAIHWRFPLDGADLKALEDLVMLCQTANAALLLGSTGKRIGELTGLRPDARRVEGDRCYLDGETYKSNDSPHGQLRTWPLPWATADAFERQCELCAALGRTEHLWVTLVGDKNTTGIPNLQNFITKLGKAVILPNERTLSEIDGKLTPHRFRYTVARLAALSLEGANQILFDVLGHDDMEVTLGYMQRDPELVEDINRVRREVKAVHIKEVFDHAEEHGGPAADLVRKLKAEMLARSGKEQLDTDDVQEAAAILGSCEVVRPGVICTAQPLERGACSSSLGIRDVAACTSGCHHRLEFAAKKQDRRKLIDSALKSIVGAKTFDRAFLQNQILASFQPFPDLIEEFASDPRLKPALGDCDPIRWAKMSSVLRERLDPILGRGNDHAQ